MGLRGLLHATSAAGLPSLYDFALQDRCDHRRQRHNRSGIALETPNSFCQSVIPGRIGVAGRLEESFAISPQPAPNKGFPVLTGVFQTSGTRNCLSASSFVLLYLTQ
jgi:hypothetical protein